MNVLDPQSLLSQFGPMAVLLILFAETGLLFGFFLPGDSLLFTAGLLTTTGIHLGLLPLLIIGPVGAIAGAQTGFLLGRRFGASLIERTERPGLRLAARRAREYLESYGVGKAVVLARFVPGVRTVMNPLAGALGIDARRFTRWQVIGGFIWTDGLILAGHLLGSRIPNVDRYLLLIVLVVMIVPLIPLAVEAVKLRRHAKAGQAAAEGGPMEEPDRAA